MAEGSEQSQVRIEEVRMVSPAVVAALGRLVPQLSSSSSLPSSTDLEAIVASPGAALLVAVGGTEVSPEILGTLTLAWFRTPTGVRAWIEDVIVDESARGRGIGALITLAAIDRARVAGAKTVDLTSRPSREAANRLYQRLGFASRDTNVYRYSL